jgi:hypothetical protein
MLYFELCTVKHQRKWEGMINQEQRMGKGFAACCVDLPKILY